MSKKKKFLGLFAILFVAIFAMGCVFATACGKKNEEESEPEHVHEYTVLNQGDADGHYYTCPDDGDKGEVTPHTYGEWKTEKEADCGNYGTQTRTCSVCGYVDIDTTTLTPTGNHTYPTDNSAATWNWTWDEEKGYTAVTATVTCTVCNQSTTVTGTITATPDDGVYGEYEATASVGNQTYTTTKTASEFPYDPDEVAYSMSLDFSDPTTYGWMVEGLTPSQNDAGHDMYTLATSTAYTSGIVTYTTHSSGNNTINKDNDSEALYTAGSSSNFKINLAGLEGDYITITVRMSSNGSEEATATDDRILAVNTTASTSNALDSVTSNYKTDYQTLEYGQEITASDTALYLAWSGNIRIYELEINIYGEAEPDLSGDTGEGSGSGEGEIDEELFAVSAEQNVELSDTSTSASVAVSVTYDGQPYTSGEYEGYVVYIYSSDEGIASVSKEVAGGYITISTAAVSGTATVTVAVVNSSAYTTNIAYSNISVTVTGIGPDTTDMVSESITFTEAQAGDYTTDLSLFESDDLTVVAKATEDKKITIDSNNKTDPETEEKYSYRLKTNSAGTAEYGNITITTTGAAVIRFSIFSGSSGYSNIRTANFYKYVDGTNDELLYTNDGVLGDGNYVVIWTVSVSEAGTYYFASKSSSLSVYAVDILYTATVEEDENAAGYDTPAAADASVGPIGEWAGTAYFEITYTLLGTSNTDMCKADVSIVVTESTFTLETDEFVDVKGSLASLLNALTEGIYLSTSYTGSNGTYYVSYYDSDFGQINITALVGQDEKGDYLSVTFSMNVSINIGITVSATIVIDDQRVRRTDDHVHSYTGNGGYDDENHWTGTCSCGGKTGIVEHTYEWSGSTATCTQAGTETGTCSCGATTTREAAATGHTYPEATSSEITWDWANRNGDTMTVTVSFTCTACNGTVTTTSTYRYENGCLVAVAKFNGNESVEYEGSYELSNVGTALDLAEALENGVSEITLKGDVTLEEGETLSITSDVTINLGNYTITSSADSSENVITVSEGANVVITDGTIVNSYVGVSSGDNSAAIYVENGYVTLDGVTITSSSVGVRAVNGSVDITDTKITSDYWAIWESEGKVTVTINGDSEITGKAKTIYVAGDSNGYAETGFEEDSQTILIVNGGTIKSESESAISTYGLASMESAVVIINGGTIIGANVVDAEGYGTPFPAVYIPNGYLIVTGGEISGSTAVEIRGGTAYITGGIFNSIATADVTGKESNNAKTYGYALAVYPYSTTKRDSDEKFNNDVAVYVSGGEFNAALYMYNFSEVDKFEISGGKFTSDPTNYIADGYTVSTPDENLTDWYEVVKGTKITSADDLTAALAAVTEGDEVTIVLGADISDAVTVAAGDVTIDLNGYTLTATTESGKNVVTVEEGASLTITGGTIKNEYTGNSSIDNSAAIYSEGTLVLDGVTIESSSVGVRAVSGTVDMTDTTIESGYWAIWESAGTVTVTLGEGTVITGDDKTIFVGGDADYGYDGYQVGAVTTLIVDGATIESNGESAISTFGTATSSSAIVIIKSGTITGYADDTTACPAVYIPNGTLYVYGGTITGSTALEIRGGTAYICGGEFISSYEEEPNAAYNTSGATTMGYALAVYPYKSTMRDSDTNFNNDVAVYVSGGSFTGAVYAADKSEVGDYTFVISAGFFTVQPAEALLAEGYAAYRTGDGTGYTVVEDISGTWMLTNFKYTVIPVFGVVYVDVTLEISNDGTFTFTIKDIRWGGDSMIYPYTVCSDNSWYVNADGTFSFVILEGEDGKNENIANVKLGEDENGDECLLLSFTLNLGELDDLDLGGLESLASAITITVTDAEIYKANV